VERRYFTEMNAARIDGMRARIAAWAADGLLTIDEEALLVADLLVGASRVANTAGTFGCFLRRWHQNAVTPIRLEPRRLLRVPVGVEALTGEVADVPAAPEDVAYFDPPYTKRQYAAYYHILETIAHGDAPTVVGVTGLRPWRHRASAFCYRTRALRAIVDLVTASRARRVFLSYSSEGHVDLRQLTAELSAHGHAVVHTLGSIGRYAPNESARENGTDVTEYLVEFTRYPA
jgi:adenine-specific DNA-methyltransferase